MGLRVLNEQCETCIFRPGNKMHLNKGRVASMVRQCARDQTHITCHETLKTVTGDASTEAVCRGFYDAHGHVSQMIRIAGRLGAIEFVDSPAHD